MNQIKANTMFIYDIQAPTKKLIEVIDWCYANCLSFNLLNDPCIDYKTWCLIKDHWLDKVNLDSNIPINISFRSNKDATVFKLTYGDLIHHD